jgi:hypothetical protein
MFYNEQLAQTFGPVVLSEAQRERMRIEFQKLQFVVKRQQTTNTWQVPLKLEFFDDGTYKVDILDEQQVLFLDW